MTNRLDLQGLMATSRLAPANEPMEATSSPAERVAPRPARGLGAKSFITVEVEPADEAVLREAARVFWTSFASIATELLLAAPPPDVRAA